MMYSTDEFDCVWSDLASWNQKPTNTKGIRQNSDGSMVKSRLDVLYESSASYLNI